MSKQTILNYEVQMIEYQSQGLSKPDSTPNHQYNSWDLDQKILPLIGLSPHTIRWIGNHEMAYLDAFVYVMLSTSLKKESLILKLKQKVYDLSQKYLQKSSQKLIVEFLCLMQYTQDKYSFLRKYPEVVKMIVSILKSFEKSVNHKDSIDMSSFILESPIKQKRKESFSIFCEKFDFITVFHPNESTYKFVGEKDVIFVVVEKDCFFVVEKHPVLSDEKDHSYKKTSSKIKYSTPRFCISNNTLHKPKSQKQHAENHKIHKNKKSQNLLDHYNNESIQCSLQEIYRSLENCEEHSEPQNRENIRYRTENQIPSKQIKKQPKGSKKKYEDHEDMFLLKQIEFQQKRKQHWLKLEREYYERKKQISRKIKRDKTKMQNERKHLLLFRKNQPKKSQKQRKMSFNSFTGTSLKDRFDNDLAQLDYDKKSTTKSHQGQLGSKEHVRERKISLRQIPVVKKKKMLKKKTNKDNRLSVIQEENRLKFWNFNSKANTLHRSPKYTSFNSSNRETLDANICVTFNYINKHQHSLEGLYSPNFHKVRCCGSPIRT